MLRFGTFARLCVTLLIASCALSAHARQPGNTQDLLDIWQMAQQRDPIYAASQAERNAQQEKIPQAKAQLLPYITADGVAEHNDRRRISGLHDNNSNGRALWSLTLTQPIFDLSAWSGLQQAEYVAGLADVQQASAYQDLILRVAQAYFDVLAAQDTLRALRAQKEAVDTQLRAAHQGFELGSTTIADTYEAQARLDLINASELQAENVLQLSTDQLARLINERPGKLATLPSDTVLPSPSPHRLDAWVEQSRHSSLEVTHAQLAAQIAEKQIDIAQSQHYPRLSLQAQTGSASDRGLYETNSGPRSLNSSIGLQLSIPIFTGGEISSVVREQTSRLQQARYLLENARRQAVQSTQQHFSGVTSGLAQISVLRSAEQSSLASLQANQTGYEVGVRVNIDVLNAQQQLYETQRNLARARYDTLMSGLRLKASSGVLTDQDIVAINSLLRK